MKKIAIAAGVSLTLVLLLALAASRRGPGEDATPATTAPPPVPSPTAAAPDWQGLLYGRVTTGDSTTYQGRLRWGGGEEAFWSDFFNGFKDDNPWAVHVPPERLTERHPVEIFGLRIAQRKRRIDLGRPFMARFGDIARIEARGRELRVTLKSGSVFLLDRFDADDFADGLRVWDRTRGVVDLGERQMRSVELLPTAALAALPRRLHGTVRTRHGEFTGHLQWNREECVGSDTLDGRTAEGEVSLPFGSVRSIARHGRDSSRVTLRDGRELVLSGSREAGRGHRGIHVDDRRYGRVLISWDAFERVDLSPGGSGAGYDDFPPGSPLTGTVTTRAGRRWTGRLVYDLDESKTTETLDAPAQGVDYTIPFGLIAAIEPGGDAGTSRHARVVLHDGEELRLDPGGDLGAGNAGMLVFAADRRRPEYVPWSEVERIELERPPAMYPPLGGR